MSHFLPKSGTYSTWKTLYVQTHLICAIIWVIWGHRETKMVYMSLPFAMYMKKYFPNWFSRGSACRQDARRIDAEDGRMLGEWNVKADRILWVWTVKADRVLWEWTVKAGGVARKSVWEVLVSRIKYKLNVMLNIKLNIKLNSKHEPATQIVHSMKSVCSQSAPLKKSVLCHIKGVIIVPEQRDFRIEISVYRSPYRDLRIEISERKVSKERSQK